jgi:hypothetical protein
MLPEDELIELEELLEEELEYDEPELLEDCGLAGQVNVVASDPNWT